MNNLSIIRPWISSVTFHQIFQRTFVGTSANYMQTLQTANFSRRTDAFLPDQSGSNKSNSVSAKAKYSSHRNSCLQQTFGPVYRNTPNEFLPMQKVHLFPCNNEISMCMYVFENESCSWLTTAWRVGKRWPLSALSPKRGNQSSAFNSERFVGRRTRADAEPRKAHKRHSEWTNRAPASLAVLYTGWVIKYSALPLNLGRFEPACFFSRRSLFLTTQGYRRALSVIQFGYYF